MNDTKRCCGYKGYWTCAEKYPDHMLPIGEFGFENSGRGTLRGICRGCDRYKAASIRHPVTRTLKRDWKKAYAESLGGTRGTPEWQSFLDSAEVQWRKETKDIEAEAWLNIIFPTPPKDDLPAAKAARKRTNLEPLDKLPPEGWVYIIAASRHASIMKIGSTFENGIRDRLSEAKRWALAGSAVLLHKEWFSRCKQAESLVHRRLDYCRIVSPDAGDELFRTSFEHALANVMIIKNEVENDREKQKVG